MQESEVGRLKLGQVLQEHTARQQAVHHAVAGAPGAALQVERPAQAATREGVLVLRGLAGHVGLASLARQISGLCWEAGSAYGCPTLRWSHWLRDA